MSTLGPTLGPRALKAAQPILFTLAVTTSVCALSLIVGGIFIGTGASASTTVMDLFGAKITTGNVGLAMAFIGAIAQVVIVSKLVSAITEILKNPDAPEAPAPTGLPPSAPVGRATEPQGLPSGLPAHVPQTVSPPVGPALPG